jgi:hypothetical protein
MHRYITVKSKDRDDEKVFKGARKKFTFHIQKKSNTIYNSVIRKNAEQRVTD